MTTQPDCPDCGSRLGTNDRAGCEACAEHVVEASGFCRRCGHACAHTPPHPLRESATGLVCADAVSCEQRRGDLLAPCPSCGHYRDTPNHEHGCAVGRAEQ